MKVYKIVIDALVPFGSLLRKVEGEKYFYSWHELFWRSIPHTFFIYWLFSFIPVIGTNLYSILLVPLSAYLHIKTKGITDITEKKSIFLIYFVVIIIGFGGLWGFIGHTFLADTVALNIGWLPGSPFQTELAFYHLGFAIAGLLTIWLKDHMITALVISKSVFWYGAAYVHIRDIFINQNFSPLNVGAPLIADIILPTIMLYLLFPVLKKGSFCR
ncbi:MAG: hypothetical protein OCD02_22850 [Spirochaetaceae bacterium]